MLIKLTQGVSFTNMFTRSFYARRSRKSKKTDDLTVFLMFLGTAHAKAARKMLMKLTAVPKSKEYSQFFVLLASGHVKALRKMLLKSTLDIGITWL